MQHLTVHVRQLNGAFQRDWLNGADLLVLQSSIEGALGDPVGEDYCYVVTGGGDQSVLTDISRLLGGVVVSSNVFAGVSCVQGCVSVNDILTALGRNKRLKHHIVHYL